MRALQPPQRVLQVGPARAQHHQLRALRREPPCRLDNEVDALLVIEPPDEDQQRRVGPLGQAELALQGALARGLALPEVGERVPAVAELLAAALLDQEGVAARAPLLGVDPVDDAGELPAPGGVPQGLVQAPPALGRLDLPRVPPGDRNDPVRGLDAGLEDVGVLPADGVVEVEGGAALARGDRKEVRVRGGPPPLVCRVVQHQDAASVLVLPVVAVVRLEQDGQQSDVPVVCDEDEVVLSVHRAAAGHDARGLEGGLGEEGAPERDL